MTGLVETPLRDAVGKFADIRGKLRERSVGNVFGNGRLGGWCGWRACNVHDVALDARVDLRTVEATTHIDSLGPEDGRRQICLEDGGS
ncbi:uncharacterized protein KD926_002226 [Aspergillus affinis]|uniref:uncharacterized protein n=1 Tax=Aspergillus affinis TaxID=1070780 RepID=UPI0022FE9B63|nr:uncharacterized protein KD926_002226 [Aspergillus affinis]KAI9036196.1 hypothetical protein KD926_002226 [Aspergillus affinis]